METLVKITKEENPDSMIYIFEGELDETNTDNTFENIYGEIEKNKYNKLIFDFDKLTYINSKTIGYLVDIFSNIEENDGKMYIKNCPDRIKDTLNFTGVDTIIPYLD